MMKPAEEQTFWKERLVTWPRGIAVGFTGLGREDVDYLAEIGLPTGIDWTLSISPPANPGEISFAAGLPIIAQDASVPICVRPDGVLVAVEPTRRRLVNSSVRAFGRFLMRYQQYRKRVQGLDEPEALALVSSTRDQMREADEVALQGSENYWSVILEQMAGGLL